MGNYFERFIKSLKFFRWRKKLEYFISRKNQNTKTVPETDTGGGVEIYEGDRKNHF